MIRINFQNIEEYIFQNNKIWGDLPDLKHIRDEWKLSKISPVLRNLTKKTIFDLLNKLNKEHEKIISKHLGTSVVVDKIDYCLVKSYDFDINDIEDVLNSMDNEFYSYYFSSCRRKDKISVTFWR